MKPKLLSIVVFCAFLSCSKQDTQVNIDPQPQAIYFPALSGSQWESVTPASLGWNETALTDLYSFLQANNSKGFIILYNGRIAAEKYFGTFTQDSTWYWASAGKSLTSFIAGIAQQEGSLNINNSTSQYLGTGWTSLPLAKENLITVKHQLTMTTGLDDAVTPDNDCTDPACLQYKADAGSRWAYHNAPYTLIGNVIQAATGKNYNTYTQEKVLSKTGMNGLWIPTGFNRVFYSNTRSMARYGLLILNKGKWDQTTLLTDQAYYTSMTSSSQTFNNSYGYLWWLNGKSSYMLPGFQAVIPGSLVPNAPADAFAALGKNDQKIYVVPSLKLVLVRCGNAAASSQQALSSFDNQLWAKVKAVVGY